MWRAKAWLSLSIKQNRDKIYRGSTMPERLQITVNGEPQALSAPASIATLLDQLQLKGRLAVEVNGEIVPRGEHAQHSLRAGDRVEIVRAIGGG